MQDARTGGGDNPAARYAGIAWIICAALTGYLALLQLNAAQSLSALGSQPGDYQALALWNGLAAVVTLFFAVRLFQHPGRGFLAASAIWGALSVAGGVVQISGGATSDVFLASTVAAGVAGVLSLAARSAAPEGARELPPFSLPPGPAGGSPPAPPAPAPTLPPAPTAPLVPVTPATERSDDVGTRAETPPATGRRRRPWLMAGAIVVVVAAVALGGLQSGAFGPGALPTPSPLPSPTPVSVATRAPSLAALPAGPITFGKKSYKVGDPIEYTATLNQDPGSAALFLEVLSSDLKQVIGSDSVGSGEDVGSEFSGTLNFTGADPGTYVIRIESGGLVLAEGKIKLTK